MKRHLILLFGATSLVCGESLPPSVALTASDGPPSIPDQLSFQNIAQLNKTMLASFEVVLGVTQLNLRNCVPLIRALFSGPVSRFLFHRTDQPPIEAPPVPWKMP